MSQSTIPLHDLFRNLLNALQHPFHTGCIPYDFFGRVLPRISKDDFARYSKALFKIKDTFGRPTMVERWSPQFGDESFYAWLAVAVAPEGAIEINSRMTTFAIRNENDFRRFFPEVYNHLREHLEERLFIRRLMAEDQPIIKPFIIKTTVKHEPVGQ